MKTYKIKKRKHNKPIYNKNSGYKKRKDFKPYFQFSFFNILRFISLIPYKKPFKNILIVKCSINIYLNNDLVY